MESERTKLLRKGIMLKKELDRNKGKALSGEEMDKMLKFSQEVDRYEKEGIRERQAKDPNVIYVEKPGSRSAGIIKRGEGSFDIEWYDANGSEVSTPGHANSLDAARKYAFEWVTQYGKSF